LVLIFKNLCFKIKKSIFGGNMQQFVEKLEYLCFEYIDTQPQNKQKALYEATIDECDKLFDQTIDSVLTQRILSLKKYCMAKIDYLKSEE